MENDISLSQALPHAAHTKFQWATLLPLRGKDTISLVGSFQFVPINVSNRVRQLTSNSNWNLLEEACTLFGIKPPTLSILRSPSCTTTIIKITASFQEKKPL